MRPCPIIIFLYTKNWQHSPECLRIFPEMFDNIPWNVWRHSPECLITFPGIFGDIPRNFWQHFSECLATFFGMFGDIPQNVWQHSPGCLAIFPGMFEDILRNVWWHSPQCLATFSGMFGDSPPIPRVSRIPFPVPIPGFIHSQKRLCIQAWMQFWPTAVFQSLLHELFEVSVTWSKSNTSSK